MSKQVIDYIRQPEGMENQSVEHLRNVVEKYPYYHAARILLLRTLYQMHDSSFDEQLRKAAIYVPSRKTLFQMFEADNIKPESPAKLTSRANEVENGESRTTYLIENFIESMPEPKPSKAPRTIDATTDYMAYLMQSEAPADVNASNTPPMTGQSIIDIFLEENNGRFEIADIPDAEMPSSPASTEAQNDTEPGVLTEAMARIYIKQGKFDKAIKIIQRISLNNPKKNRYFADQIRFLEKLAINEKNK